MREITPRLTNELKRHCGSKTVWRAAPYRVSTYRSLVEHIARLAYLNRDELLFFRGQDRDYLSKTRATTLYPSIYRGDSVSTKELRYRFGLLDGMAKHLVEEFKRK